MKTLLIFLIPLPALAVIDNVRISGTTATQAVIEYTAPGEQACTIRVSESPTYLPPVHDMDESLFPGSSSDARPGALTDGPMRAVVIGKHGMMATGASNPFLASDGQRYSRALQANTTHYYRITCGADTATGTFTTGNIPPGSTFSEPLAADATTPGAYNWPTEKSPSDRSESWVDPNTGSLIRKVTLPSDNNSPGNFLNTWPTGGMMQLCAENTISSGGHTYALCDLWNGAVTLVSIETDTGTVYPLSRVYVAYNTFPTCNPQSGFGAGRLWFSKSDPTQFYFGVTCPGGALAGKSVVFGAKWNGSLYAAQSVVSSPMVKSPDLVLTLITPVGYDIQTLLAAYDARYTSALQSNLTSVSLVGSQNGHLIYQADYNQDMIGFVFVFDPGNRQPLGSGGTGGIVASNPFWQAGAGRWCGLHTTMTQGDNNTWISIDGSWLGQGPGACGDDCTQYGGASYWVSAANDAGYSDTVQIASYSGSYQPHPGVDSRPQYLQDAAVGDEVFIYKIGAKGNGEPAEIASIDAVNHTWTLIRPQDLSGGTGLAKSIMIAGSDVPPATSCNTPQCPNCCNPSFSHINITAGTKLYMSCRATSFSSYTGTDSQMFYWNYAADPTGVSITPPAVNGTTSNQVIENWSSGGHEATRNAVNVMSQWLWWKYPGGIPGFDLVSNELLMNGWPTFAGKSALGIESHPSYEPASSAAWDYVVGQDRSWFVDANPLLNNGNTGVPYGGTGTLVGSESHTYKINPVTLNRKFLTTFASCGKHPLTDISSAATGNVISDSTPYTYCVANAANECRSGSSAGDAFLNCPTATMTTCKASLGVFTDVDLCLGDTGAYSNSATQISSQTGDSNGGYARVISQMFATNHNENVFNSVRPTPDGTWMLFSTPNLTGLLEAYMAKLPPFPAADSTRRDTFVPVEVRFGGLARASTAIVEFGYAENGDPNAYYCTSRREACVAQSYAIDEQQPFYYAVTEANLVTGTPVTCSLLGRTPLGVPRPRNCTITIPALPGRVVYYRLIYRDHSGNAIGNPVVGASVVP